VPLLLLGPQFFPIILFVSTTQLTGMLGISFQMQWPLTSQFHGSFLKENKWYFIMNQTARPYPTWSLPAQFLHRMSTYECIMWVLTKPLITEEIWPGRGMNPGLTNPVLYPLLHKLMLSASLFGPLH
jgi:hypothetical protein